MSVIVWDGKTLAADCQTTRGNTLITGRKIWRLPTGQLVGIVGAADHSASLLVWLHDMQKPWPVTQTKDDYSIAVVVQLDGSLRVYDRTPDPSEVRDQFFALGCGRDAAYGALEMGATAEEAVAAACKWSDGCGKGVDVLHLEFPK